MESQTAIELKIQDLNNVLGCHAFVQIHFAPKNAIVERHFQQLYCTRHNGNDIFLHLVDYLPVTFSQVSSLMTLPATGLQSHEWRDAWMKKYPGTTAETKMAVYYYKKAR